MTLPSGTKLGPYEIQSPLGAGGMGEVYRARDARLDRVVAIKVLPANLASDPALRQRLEREAKAVSKLSHPHICILHDIGHQDNIDFLVMEYVEGETLEQRLSKGPLPPEQTVRYAAQLAGALAKAHKLGITHRDLKPSNVMVTKSGAKLMDFGLAKQSGTAPLAAALTEMTMEQSKLTGDGTIVGTFQYMAPEQLEGKEADARTDIFALGEVIYEMATGKPAFTGQSRASLIAAILTADPPPMTQAQPMTPSPLERVVKKCLAKDPDERWQSASDLASELTWLAEGGTSSALQAGLPAPAAQPRRKGERLALILAALAAAALAAYYLRPALPPPRITGYTQITHDGWQKNSFGQTTPIVLTDGARLYIQETVHGRFVVAQVSASGGDTVSIATSFPNAALDNMSPDRSELVVGSFTGTEIDQPLFAVPTLGGSPRRLVDLPGQDATWMANGDLLVSHANELTAVHHDGTSSIFLRLGDATAQAYWLRWSPDRQVLRFTLTLPNRQLLAEVSADGSNYHRMLDNWHLGDDLTNGNWTPDGKLFVFQAVHNWGRADLWVIREKSDLFHKANREPMQLTAGPLNFYSPQPSLDGKKIYAIGEQPRSELVRYDAKSGQFLPYLEGISARTVSFSRDGQWVSYVSYPEGNLWRCRIDGSDKLQLTSAPLFVVSARWSPDGRKIAISATKPGIAERIYLVPAEGGAVRELVVEEFGAANVSWAADGSSITFNDIFNPGYSKVRSVDLKTMQVTVIPDSDKLIEPVRSPDGQFLAATNVAGDALLLFNFATQKWSELTKTAIGFVEWSADSKFVYFDNGFSADQAVYRARVADHKVEQVASLRDFRRVVTPISTWFGITPDGAPLLMRDIGNQEVYALDLDAP